MLQVDGIWFRDSKGRAVMLRGVNLSGATKLPQTPFVPSHQLDKFFESEYTVSFVGRPFPLNEADEHFARLRHWGFNFLRFNVTWEALEHAGPGQYDTEYMDYVVAVLRKAKEYGFKCFIDPHQDVWSRYCGGSGAPSWTLRVVGFEPRNFKATSAALVHNTYDDPSQFPRMIWPTNYHKLACATMFTLFFGGRAFAPNFLVETTSSDTLGGGGSGSGVLEGAGTAKVNIQDYLQGHYIAAVARLAARIHSESGLEDDVVIGYDTLNEPHPGFIGVEDLSRIAESQELKNGETPTPFQTMLLGEGVACDVDMYDFGWRGPVKVGTANVDPKGVSAWVRESSLKGHSSSPPCPIRTGGCIWAEEGVWDRETRQLLRPNYFHRHPDTGRKVDFMADFWKPFVTRFGLAIRKVHSTAVIFVEPPVNTIPAQFSSDDISGRLVYAPHWYDGLTLMNKRFNRWFTVDIVGYIRKKYPLGVVTAIKLGESSVRESFRNQLQTLQKEGVDKIGSYPLIMGEIGIPFDMDNKNAYRTGDYSSQVRALDANLYALESNLLNFTLWNYCPDNNNTWGDNWNGEDLSLFCRLPKRGGSADSRATTPTVIFSAADTDVGDSGINESDSLSVLESSGRFATKSAGGKIQMTTLANSSTLTMAVPSSSMSESVMGSAPNTPPAGTLGAIDRSPSSSTEDDTNTIRESQSLLNSSGNWKKPLSTAPTNPIPPTLPADLDVGGRALVAFVRPYPVYTPGTPLTLKFDSKEGAMHFVFRRHSSKLPASGTSTRPFSSSQQQPRQQTQAPDGDTGEWCEIYIPRLHFPNESDLEIWSNDANGRWKVDLPSQRIWFRCGPPSPLGSMDIEAGTVSVKASKKHIRDLTSSSSSTAATATNTITSTTTTNTITSTTADKRDNDGGLDVVAIIDSFLEP
ncbi:hypothetical protein HK102_012891 [Quaeritorhiza haematococci]|nr:hypothetical protein HK102_012891 [Quaeritorhiza haematococci]